MNTLRAKLAILLVAAIVAVVALATLVAISVIGLPSSKRFLEATARQIAAIAAEAERQTDSDASTSQIDRWFTLRSRPIIGGDPEQTRSLRSELAHLGSSLEPIVAERPDVAGLIISIPIADRGWIVVPLVEPERPRGSWQALISWMLVIVVGAITLAVRVAYKMTQPLHLIEGAVASVGTGGVLPPVPESGSAEVRATARALNRLSAHLKSAMESRMRLVAAAGHDLRTPMTRMRLRAEFVADEEERAAWLKDLAELNHIADSAIGLVREEVADSTPEPVRLDSLAQDVVEELTDLGFPIKAGVLEPTLVNAAPWALKRALRNLAVNAATHGGGSMVTVERINGTAIVRILDHGPGIPNELLAQVFEPFFQVDPGRRRNFDGAGLGLAIAKEIIARQGGSVILENRTEGGLCQTIALPEADNAPRKQV